MKLLILFLLFSCFAEAQFVSGGAIKGQLPGDNDSTKLLLSMRKAKTTYSGNCVKIRRQSDNAVQDIGFLGWDFDTVAFNTFLGTDTGYIDTWYDQSGLGRHATQTNLGAQPRVIKNHKNGHATIFFDGNDSLTVTGLPSDFNFLHTNWGLVNIVFSPGVVPDPNTIYTLVGNHGGGSFGAGIMVCWDDRASVPINNGFTASATKGVSTQLTVINSITNVLPQMQYHLLQILFQVNTGLVTNIAHRSDAVVDSVNLIAPNTGGATTATVNATYNMKIGAVGASPSNLFVGYMAEVSIYGGAVISSVSPSLLADVAINQNYYWDLYGRLEYDQDALAYINRVATAGYIMPENKKKPINTYFKGLKDGGIWGLIVDRGLPIWGSAAPSLVTFKAFCSPTAVNSPTFDFTGVDWNGTSQYINLNISPGTNVSTNGAHLAYYSGDTIQGINNCFIGAATTNQRMEMWPTDGLGNRRGRLWLVTGELNAAYTNSNGGYFILSRSASNDLRWFTNGVQQGATFAAGLGTRPTHNLYLGARNNTGTTDFYTISKCQMWSFGHGMTAALAAIDNRLTEQLMDDLGIGVQP